MSKIAMPHYIKEIDENTPLALGRNFSEIERTILILQTKVEDLETRVTALETT